MSSLKDLKKNAKERLQKLQKITEDSKSGSNNKQDDKFWYPQMKNESSGFALIRFLPAAKVDGEDGVEYVQTFSYAYQHPATSKWYIEESRKTLGKGEKDPFAEWVSSRWQTAETQAQKDAIPRAKKTYISNILVINDPVNPDNNGKVFLFKYGPKIWKKIESLMFPDEEFGEEASNPFDFWEGRNFRIKIKMTTSGQNKFRNYDDSVFDMPSVIAESDDEIEKIWEAQHSLLQFKDPSKFKSYEDLKKRLDDVLGAGSSAARPVSKTAEQVSEEIDEDFNETPTPSKATTKKVSKPADDDEFDLSEIDALLADD